MSKFLSLATKRELKGFFAQHERGGFITDAQFVEVMEMMGTVEDTNGTQYAASIAIQHFKAHVQQPELSMREFIDCVGAAVESRLQAYDDQGEASAGMGNFDYVAAQYGAMGTPRTKKKAKPVKYVSGSAYLKHACSCQSSSKNYDFKWAGTKAMDPKTRLITTVCFVGMMMILLLVGVLNVVIVDSVIDEADKVVSYYLQLASDSTATVMDETRAGFIQGLDGTAKKLEKPIDETQVRGSSIMHSLLVATLQHFLEIVRVEGELHIHNMSSLLAMRLSTVSRTMRLAHLSTVTVVTLFEQWLAEDADHNVILMDLASTPTRVLLEPWQFNCSNCPEAATVPCIQRVNQSSTVPVGTAVTATDVLPIWGHVASASIKLTDQLIACLFHPLNGSQRDELRASIHEVFADVNVKASSDEKQETELVMVTQGANFPLIHANISELTARYFNMVGHGPFSGEMLNGVPYHGAYGVVLLPAFEASVIATIREPSDFFKKALPSKLPQHLPPRVGNVTLRAAFQHPTAFSVYGEHILRSEKDSPHIRLGLSGMSGVLSALNGEGETVVAGYTAVPNSTFTILSELDTDYVNSITLSVLKDALQLISVQSPSNVEFFAFTRDSQNNISFFVMPKYLRVIPDQAMNCFSRQRMDQRLFGKWDMRCVYIPDLEMVIVVNVNKQLVIDKLWINVGISFGCAVGLLLIFFLFVRKLTYRILDQVEKDYVDYKHQIEDEKLQFSELTKDIMPVYIKHRSAAGEKLIIDRHPRLTFFFSDLAGFTEKSRKLDTQGMVRLLGYMFMLEDAVAEYYNIHKVKTIGDAFFAVCGLDDVAIVTQASARAKEDRQKAAAKKDGKEKLDDDGSRDDASDDHEKEEKVVQNEKSITGENDQTYRMVSFACALMQFLSGNFMHYPHRTACFEQYADPNNAPLKLFDMRTGIHTGPSTAGVLDVGRAPHFECLGPTVVIASKMEATARSNRIQLSEAAYDIVVKIDEQRTFQFEPPKKTLVKGHGTLITRTVKSTNLQVPEELIQKLKIDRATKRKFFTELGAETEHRQVAEKEASQSQTESESDVEKEQSFRETTSEEMSAISSKESEGYTGLPNTGAASPAFDMPQLPPMISPK